jgi:hypothetical protein
VNRISGVHLVLRYCNSGRFPNDILIIYEHDFVANFGFVCDIQVITVSLLTCR